MEQTGSETTERLNKRAITWALWPLAMPMVGFYAVFALIHISLMQPVLLLSAQSKVLLLTALLTIAAPLLVMILIRLIFSVRKEWEQRIMLVLCSLGMLAVCRIYQDLFFLFLIRRYMIASVVVYVLSVVVSLWRGVDSGSVAWGTFAGYFFMLTWAGYTGVVGWLCVGLALWGLAGSLSVLANKSSLAQVCLSFTVSFVVSCTLFMLV